MTAAYVTGLLLGLGLIVPIGAQNVFVFGQGLAVGMPRALWAVVAAACCDTLLIVSGAVGAAALIASVPGLRPVLLAGGAVFLAFLGVRSLRAKPGGHGEAEAPGAAGTGSDGGPGTGNAAVTAVPVRAVLSRTVLVSLLNPHAVFDTVVVIGAAIAAQAAAVRPAFAMGTVSASWLWFLVLAGAAALLRRVLTEERRVWFDRVSGVILLVFAGMLTLEFVRGLG